MKPLDALVFVIATGFSFLLFHPPPAPLSAVATPEPTPPPQLTWPEPAVTFEPAQPQDPAEHAMLKRIEDQLLGPLAPWDEHATAPLASPDGVAALLDDLYSDGVDVLELDCNYNPCVATVEYPANFDVLSTIAEMISGEAGWKAIGGNHDPDADYDDLRMMTLSIYGQDVAGDPGIMNRMVAAKLAIENPVSPDSEETNSPIYTGTGWP